MDPRKLLVLLMFLLLFALPGLSPAWANLIVNGDFETGNLSGWTQTPAAQGSLFGVNSADPHGGSYAAFFGATAPPSGDSISQTFADVPGQLYNVTFYLAATLVPFYPTGNNTTAQDRMYITINGVNPIWSPITNIATDTTGTPPYGMDFFGFTATGLDTLAFASYNVPGYYYLDDVSVTAAVPEPATMLLLGSGLIGLAGYGRKKFFKK